MRRALLDRQDLWDLPERSAKEDSQESLDQLVFKACVESVDPLGKRES